MTCITYIHIVYLLVKFIIKDPILLKRKHLVIVWKDVRGNSVKISTLGGLKTGQNLF